MIIVVLKSVLRDMKRALEEVHPVAVHLEYFTLPDDTEGDDVGTADALRLLRDKIKVVISWVALKGDLIYSIFNEVVRF